MPAGGFWSRVRAARLFRVLLVYVAASWIILQVAALLQNQLLLPRWVSPLAVIFLLIGFVVVCATAWVQSHPATRAKAGEVPAPWELNLKDLAGSLAERRLPHLTWARAILGGVFAFSLLFGIAGVYVVVRERAAEGRGARTGTVAEPDTRRTMLVVLPFENLGRAEDEYFADGITEEITSRLARLSGLGVIARTSAMQYKKTQKRAAEIGQELGVQYLLEGTVRWEKTPDGTSRVRVSPQLIRLSDETHVWAEPYEAPLTGIFRLQTEIAERVAQALNVTLLAREREAVESRPTDNLDAYDYYLRGNAYFLRTNEEEDTRRGAEMYERAVQLDPNFAEAWARLAWAHAQMWWFFYDRSEARLGRARKAVERAFALRPGLPGAHIARGYIYYWADRNYDAALEEFDSALKREPSDAELLAAIAFVHRRRGDWDQAVSYLTRAVTLDPRHALFLHQLGGTHVLRREYDVAARYLDRAISLAPDYVSAYQDRAWVWLLQEGNVEKAQAVIREAGARVGVERVVARLVEGQNLRILRFVSEEFQQALTEMSLWPSLGEPAFYHLAKADVYVRRGEAPLAKAYYDSARASLEDRLRARPHEASYYTLLGLAYAGLGRKGEAIRHGRRAVELLPVSKDALFGSEWLVDLADIYVRVGEHDAAIEQLAYLLTIPARVSVASLRVDPRWAPLRENPRFQKLLTETG